MKKEKGFTLIELLAVIIILGILMMVAIPSVTTYINSSRKSGYLDNAKQFITAAITAVNSADKIEFYYEKTMLLIPVGIDEKASFIKLEKGGQSPYSNTYYFAYVGVTYDNAAESYTYYYTSVDGAGQGIKLISQKELEKKEAEQNIKTGFKSETNLAYTKWLNGWYGKGPAKFKTTSDGGSYSGFATENVPNTTQLAALLEAAGGTDEVKFLLLCSATECPVLDES